jgi:hypothetical protein
MHSDLVITLEYWPASDGTHIVQITRAAGITISLRQVGWLWGEF